MSQVPWPWNNDPEEVRPARSVSSGAVSNCFLSLSEPWCLKMFYLNIIVIIRLYLSVSKYHKKLPWLNVMNCNQVNCLFFSLYNNVSCLSTFTFHLFHLFSFTYIFYSPLLFLLLLIIIIIPLISVMKFK